MKTDTLKKNKKNSATIHMPEQMFHAMKTAENTNTCGHVAVQLRTDRKDKVMGWKRKYGQFADGTPPSRRLQRQTGVTAEKGCQAGSIKTKKVGHNFHFDHPKPKEPWAVSAPGYAHGRRKIWVRTNEKNISWERPLVTKMFLHGSQLRFRSWTFAGAKSLDMSLPFNKHPATAACYITRTTMLQSETRHAHLDICLLVLQPTVQWAWLKMLLLSKYHLSVASDNKSLSLRVLTFGLSLSQKDSD